MSNQLELAFDIGANIGNKFEKILSQSKRLIAFEPNPDLANYLSFAFGWNPSITIDRRALSNEVGKKKFSLCPAHTISTFSEDWINNSRFSKDYEWNRKILVETATLDSIIDEYGEPNYIKIDVEGYEYEVFLGLSKLLNNCIISFEWAEEQLDKIKATLNHIKTLGYTKFYYTEADDTKFEEEITWKSFDELNLIERLNPERKDLWGMIYFKK